MDNSFDLHKLVLTRLKLFEQTSPLEYLITAPSKDDAIFVPFTFRYPSHVRCPIHPHSCQLPPSMNVREANSRIKVEYYVTVAVDRPLLGPVSKTKRATTELLFSNDFYMHGSLPPLSTGSLPLMLRQKDCPARVQDDGLPAYTPSLNVEIRVPEAPVLFRGQANPIKFVVHTPSEAVGRIFVRQVNMSFRTSTTTIVDSTSQRVDEQYTGTIMSGATSVDSEILKLDSGTWGRLFMPNLRPTFQSCLMQIKHSVEISVGISIGPEGLIQVSSTSWY